MNRQHRTDEQLDRLYGRFLADRESELRRLATPSMEAAARIRDAGELRGRPLGAGLGRPAVALLLVSALVVMGLVAGLIAAGQRKALLLTNDPSPSVPASDAAPVVLIPPGLTPRMTVAQVEQEVLDRISASEQQLGQAVVPARVTAVQLLPAGTTVSDPLNQFAGGFTTDRLTWAVTADGTWLDCPDCRAWSSGTQYIADDSGLDTYLVRSGAPMIVPSQSFLDELAAHGQVFRLSEPPATGVVPAGSVMALIAKFMTPKESYIGPAFGTITCVDTSKGCDAVYPVSSLQPISVWWVGFPHNLDANGVATWAMVDASSGVFLATQQTAEVTLESLQRQSGGGPNTLGVTYTSSRFLPQVEFTAPVAGFWCTPTTSARTILLPYLSGCVSQLWFIRPASVECGTPTTHPDSAALAAALLANPKLTVTDRGTLASTTALPAGFNLGGYAGRVLDINVAGSRGFDPHAVDPDHCRLLPDPGSGDPTFEAREGLASRWVLIDFNSELIVLLLAPQGYDGPSGAAAQARGYGYEPGIFGLLQSGITDLTIDHGQATNPSATPSGRFVATGSSSEPRDKATATLLPDGRVLVVGGCCLTTGNRELATSSAELWDPSTGLFTPAGVLKQGRFGHTATLLSDGRVLVIGGLASNDPFLPNLAVLAAEIWDPASMAFSPAGALGEARYMAAATLRPDGKVLVDSGTGYPNKTGIFGSIPFAGTDELWDPTTASFALAPGIAPAPYAPHDGTVLTDGRVLVIGPVGVRTWDPRTATFTDSGPLTAMRANPSTLRLADGRVLVIGGDTNAAPGVSTAETWDPTSGTLSLTTPMLKPVLFPARALLADGRVLIVGTGSNADDTSPGQIFTP